MVMVPYVSGLVSGQVTRAMPPPHTYSIARIYSGWHKNDLPSFPSLSMPDARALLEDDRDTTEEQAIRIRETLLLSTPLRTTLLSAMQLD